MEKQKFIYQIEAEPGFTILTRIVSRFARYRICIDSMQTSQSPEHPHRIVITACDTKEKNVRLSRKIEGEIDVLSVILFEQTL